LRFINLKAEVDSGGRCETSEGKAERLRTRRRLAEEAQLTPYGKVAS